MKHRIQDELAGIMAFVAAIWVVFVLEFIPGLNLLSFGVLPRTAKGLIGIPLMPFLHADWRHITANTPPLFVLLILLAGSKANSWKLVVAVTLSSGLLLWLFGRRAMHIGASGLIFGLIAFLIVSGLLEKRIVPLFIAIIVGILYGSSLVSGIVPRFGSHISWDGHLFGAIGGGIVAYALLAKGRRSAIEQQTKAGD